MYKLTKVDHLVFKIDEGLWIPNDPQNRHYQEYLKWVEEGNTPLPADE